MNELKIKINLNDHILVKLTPLGEEIYKNYYYTDTIPFNSNGQVSLQLHQFANIFGSNLRNGTEQVIVDNSIIYSTGW